MSAEYGPLGTPIGGGICLRCGHAILAGICSPCLQEDLGSAASELARVNALWSGQTLRQYLELQAVRVERQLDEWRQLLDTAEELGIDAQLVCDVIKEKVLADLEALS